MALRCGGFRSEKKVDRSDTTMRQTGMAVGGLVADTVGVSAARFALAVLLLASPITVLAADAPARKPNVIFILSDDQRYNSLGMTGDPVTRTPHLDQLAEEGVFFNQAHITSPICGPSRANFWTGQWERKNRIGFDYVSHHFISEQSFGDSWMMKLKEAGYSTAFIGKHHVKIGDRGNGPLKKNIDFCYYKEGHLGFHLDKHKVFSNLKHKTQIEGLFEATEAYLKPGPGTDYFFETADKSVKSHLKRRDPTKPFCAWINFNLPHAASIGTMGTRPDDPAFYATLYNDQADRIPFPDGYPRQEAVRGKKFKYVRYYGKNDDRKQYLPDAFKTGEQPIYEELFSLNDDPKEQRNLAGNPEYAEVLKRYRTRCQQLVTELAE